jgi:Flp pilus assembly protein TadD
MRYFNFIFWVSCLLVSFLQAEEGGGDDYAVAYREALIAYKKNDLLVARQKIDEAKKIRPEESKTFLLRGRIALAQRDFVTAETEIAAGVAADPANALALRYWGDVYFDQKLFPQAREAYLKYERKSAGDPEALVLLAYTAIGSGDLSLAGSYAKQLIPFQEKHPGFYFVRAAIAKASGNEAEAERQLHVAQVNHGVGLVTEQTRDYLRLFRPAK